MSVGVPAPQYSEADLVDEYTTKHLLPTSDPFHDALEHALSNSTKHGLPPIAVTPSIGKFLKMQCQLQGAKNILEFGTLGGYSSIWFASAGEDVQVTSLEISPKNRDVAMENVKYAGLGKQVNIILGPALDTLPLLDKEIKEGKREKFDFVFIDADWDEQWHYFDRSLKMIRRGGSIYVDNTVRVLMESGLLEGNPSQHVQGIKELIENAGADSRVDSVVIQTVGRKDHDGFLLAIVK